MHNSFLACFAFVFLVALSIVASSPTLDQPLTLENALDDEDPNDQRQFLEFQPNTHRKAVDVTDDFLEGLDSPDGISFSIDLLNLSTA